MTRHSRNFRLVEEIDIIMRGLVPYNCVTGQSLQDQQICEKFKQRILDVLGVWPPISFEHIKRCIKQRDIDAAALKTIALSGTLFILYPKPATIEEANRFFFNAGRDIDVLLYEHNE